MLALLRREGDARSAAIRRQVRGLRHRQVPILFLLSGNDPGLDEISEYFGAQGRQFRRQPNVMFRMLEGADHTLSAHWAREALLGHVATFLRQRCSLVIDRRRTRPGACARDASAAGRGLRPRRD